MPIRHSMKKYRSQLPCYKMSTNSNPTFHLFPLLPAELRSKIYILAHPPPRTITLSLSNYQRKPSYNPPPLSLTSGFAHLLVNREARAVFLAEYPRLFVGYPFPAQKDERGEFTVEGKGEGRGRGWFFNYEKDSLGMMSGVRGLMLFLRRFPEDMKWVRWLDVMPTGHCGGVLDSNGLEINNDRGLDRNDDDAGDEGYGIEEGTGFELGMKLEMQLCDMTNLRLITIRILPSPARRIFEFQSWRYAPYYRRCVKSIVLDLKRCRGKEERGRDVKVVVCHEKLDYDDTDSFAGMRTEGWSVEVEERLRVLGVLGAGCGVKRVGGEVDFDAV